MPDAEKVKALIGFANRAGKLAIGRSAVKTAYHRGILRLLILAEDGSPHHRTLLPPDATVPVFVFGLKQELGHLLGRAEAAVLGVLDRQFAESLIRFLS